MPWAGGSAGCFDLVLSLLEGERDLDDEDEDEEEDDDDDEEEDDDEPREPFRVFVRPRAAALRYNIYYV